MTKNDSLNNDKNQCQNYYPDFVSYTLPDHRRALPLHRYWWRFKKNIWYVQALGLIPFIKRKFAGRSLRKSSRQESQNTLNDKPPAEELDLKVGELVEVRSEKEIFATLDEHDKHKGLQFTREMRKYCGRRYRVYKRVEKILIETTGERRSMKIPTFILEGVICDGSAHGGCDRTCFCFWREIWLKRVPREGRNMDK